MSDAAVFLLLNYLLIIMESVMSAYLASCFFRSACRRTVYVLAVGALGLCNVVVVSLFDAYPVVKLPLLCLVQTVWIILVFRNNVVKALFTAVLLISYLTIVDSVFLMCAAMAMGKNAGVLYTSPYAYYLMCFGAKAVELLGISVLRTISRRKLRFDEMRWTDWLRTLFFPAATLLASLMLLHILYADADLASELLLCAGILLLADVMSIFLLDHMEQQQIAIRDNAILRQNLKSERDGIAAWVEAYREERTRSHDFQNQMTVLRGMAEDRVPQETFLQYLNQLLNIKMPATRYINTNRPVADVLLSQKAAVAKSRGIPFQMQMDDLSRFPLSDDELVVVLANLIDNAIEACAAIDEEDRRFLRVKIQCSEAAGYFRIENATKGPVPIQNNRVVLPRGHAVEHGFGLQNVAMILERHNAVYSIDYREKDSTFCVSAELVAAT